jgi:sec-independent protein translocase protein TatB
MFGLGAGELVIILVLALILLGPSKLPGVASGLGKAIRQFRKATRDLSDQLDIDDEVKAPFRELKAAIRDEPAPYVPPALTTVAPAPAPPAPAPTPITPAQASTAIEPAQEAPAAASPAPPASSGSAGPNGSKVS